MKNQQHFLLDKISLILRILTSIIVIAVALKIKELPMEETKQWNLKKRTLNSNRIKVNHSVKYRFYLIS